VRFDEALPQEEHLGTGTGKTFVTPGRRRFHARSIVNDAQHLAVSMADGHVLVKRVYDYAIRECVPNLAKQIVSDEQRVMNMNNVRLQVEQEVPEVYCERRLVAGSAEEPVKFLTVGVEEVLVIVTTDWPE